MKLINARDGKGRHGVEAGPEGAPECRQERDLAVAQIARFYFDRALAAFHGRRPASKPSVIENGKTDDVNARSDREPGFLADFR